MLYLANMSYNYKSRENTFLCTYYMDTHQITHRTDELAQQRRIGPSMNQNSTTKHYKEKPLCSNIHVCVRPSQRHVFRHAKGSDKLCKVKQIDQRDITKDSTE
uniref:Uncharacterized protein n=1 Tax=Strigamia maritima TaxID=126957 RepID=T1IIL5_STRMM